MDTKQIQELVHILQHSDLQVLEIDDRDLHIRMERACAPAAMAPQPLQAVAVAPVAAPAAPAAIEDTVDFNDLFEVKAIMAGVFYAASSPEEQPFATVGAKVKKGDTLCIIEAMKLMNEITAERDGEIVDVCVRNGDIVEYGQTLFKLY